MARLPAVKREELAPEHQATYDYIVGSRGRLGGPFRILLYSPAIADLVGKLGGYIRYESPLDPGLRELAILTATREADCQYAWTAHHQEARKAGVPEPIIEAVRDRKAPTGLPPREATVVRYALELLRKHRVSQQTFNAAMEMLGKASLVDLTVTVGYYGMMAGVLNAFEVEVDPGVKPLLPV
ncbi:MAG: carboxymuconolactone decarboxylase family protein [Chloroflexi bacterium]|nr:carboxymuconolactone decarboxylase family protein [Chloroflexota bacterium]